MQTQQREATNVAEWTAEHGDELVRANKRLVMAKQLLDKQEQTTDERRKLDVKDHETQVEKGANL